MQKTEYEIEAPVVWWAKHNGWYVRKLQWIGRVGAPDRFFAKNGRVVLMEFKRPGGAPRATQRRELKLLKEAGVETYVVDDVERGKDILAWTKK
jgi:hypothetical protein